MNEPSLVGEAVQLAVITADKLGAEAGRRAGACRFDGSTSRATYEHCLRLDDVGDPAWHDHYGPDETPSLLDELDIDPITAGAERNDPAVLQAFRLTPCSMGTAFDPVGEIAEWLHAAYRHAWRDAYHDEVVRVAVHHTTDSTEGEKP